MKMPAAPSAPPGSSLLPKCIFMSLKQIICTVMLNEGSLLQLPVAVKRPAGCSLWSLDLCLSVIRLGSSRPVSLYTDLSMEINEWHFKVF